MDEGRGASSETAFGQRIVALLPNLRRFALVLTRDPDAADDLVQQTCERAIAGRERFDPATRLEAWLFRIMRNAWIDLVRRRKTRGAELPVEDAEDASAVDGRRVAEARLELDDVRAVVETLPVEQREILMLVCVEGLSYRETAEILDVPVGTVMSRLARARLKLAEKMGITGDPQRSSTARGEV